MMRLGNENKLGSLEKPKDVHLSPVLFSVDNDTMTPTFKLKRPTANKLYAREIEEMYVKIVAEEATRDAAHHARE